MRIRADKTVIPKKLTKELKAADVPVTKVIALLENNGLEIPLQDEDTVAEFLSTIEAVIDSHDGIDDDEIEAQEVKSRLDNIPGWATWTEAQALEWFDTNITPLNIPPEVKTLLRAYGRVLLVLRDKNYPRLENNNG